MTTSADQPEHPTSSNVKRRPSLVGVRRRGTVIGYCDWDTGEVYLPVSFAGLGGADLAKAIKSAKAFPGGVVWRERRYYFAVGWLVGAMPEQRERLSETAARVRATVAEAAELGLLRSV
jgi:hypothetical protein